MKPFRSNLEKVLKVRQAETTKAKQALARAQLGAGQAWVAMERLRSTRPDPAAAQCLHAALAEVAARRADLEAARRREQALEQLLDEEYAAHAHNAPGAD